MKVLIKNLPVAILVGVMALLLAACAGQAVQNGPAQAVEGYFKALVAKDAQQAVNLSCAAWEDGAQIDADTFAINPATLENISCQEAGLQGEFTLVKCSGSLVLDYNGEKQALDLADQSYLTVQENGEWRMCGYQ